MARVRHPMVTHENNIHDLGQIACYETVMEVLREAVYVS